MMGTTRPGTFTAAPTIQCHIYRKHPFVNTATDSVAPNTVCNDMNTPVAAGFADFPDRQVLQSISSALEQSGSLEGNEQLHL